MAQPPQAVRYSQGTKDIGAARNLPWEHPVPRNKFWDDLPYTVGRNFLSLFGPDEPPPPSFEDAENSALSRTEKLQLLLRLLCERLDRKESEAAAAASSPIPIPSPSPPSLSSSQQKQQQPPQPSFYNTDYTAWSRTYLAIAGIQHELSNFPAAEHTLRMLFTHRKDPANLSHLHALSGLLLQQKRYAEAETAARQVVDWLDGRLGRESPQALGARRVLAEAVWMLGRREEGEKVMGEVEGVVEGMGMGEEGVYGVYGVYGEEQREMTRGVWERLRKK